MTNEMIKETIKKELLETGRPGIEELVSYMEYNGYFEAPCSGGNHLCVVGGLAEHSLNVLNFARKFAKELLTPEEMNEWKDSITICALLHDLGKVGQNGQPFYVQNYVKDGRPTKANPEQKYKISETKPFAQNKETLLHVEHCIRSVVVSQQYIRLSELEQHAILYHDGLYGTMKYEIAGHETKLWALIHWADFWSAQFYETKGLDREDEEFEME